MPNDNQTSETTPFTTFTAVGIDANADATFAQAFAAAGTDVDADEFIASNINGT